MITWYNLFNLAAWLATGLVSRSTVYDLDDQGEETILITQGNETAILFRDTFLPLQFADKNPYQIGDYSIGLGVDGNVYLGIFTP